MKIEKDIAVWEGVIPSELCKDIIEHFEFNRGIKNTTPRNNFAVEDTQLYHSERYTTEKFLSKSVYTFPKLLLAMLAAVLRILSCARKRQAVARKAH